MRLRYSDVVPSAAELGSNFTAGAFCKARKPDAIKHGLQLEALSNIARD